MKKTIIVLTTALSLVMIASVFGKTRHEDIRVEFNKKTTQYDLDRIQKEMAAKNVQLDYEKTEFDKKGRLVRIKFKVKRLTGGGGGSAESPELKNNSKFGFLYDFEKKSGYNVIIGDLSKF